MSVVESSDKLLYSIPEASRALGRGSRTVIYDLLHQGKLRAVRMGGRTLIPRESLEEYVASLPAHNIGDGEARRAQAPPSAREPSDSGGQHEGPRDAA